MTKETSSGEGDESAGTMVRLAHFPGFARFLGRMVHQESRREMNIAIRSVALAWLAAGLAGCELLGPDGGSGPEAELRRNRATWSAVAAESYRFRLVRTCECLAAVSGPFRVTVAGGEVVAAESEWTGEAVPAGLLGAIESVEDLFTHIERGLETGASRVDVTYHPLLGYPTKVHVVHAPMVDEPVFAADGLVVLTTR